jgi:hypothetical protein
MPIEPMRRWNMEPWEAGPPAYTEAFYDTLETLALRDANDIHVLSLLKLSTVTRHLALR